MMNRKQIFYMASSLVLGGLISGCAALGIGGEADSRWADYRSWTQVTDGETGDPTNFIGKVHAGPTGYRNVFVNETGLETIGSADDERKFPIGSVVVKEQFKNEAAWKLGKGGDVTVAVKVSDDAPAPGSGNWIWANSLTSEAGESAFCSGCHTIAAKHDFMFTGGGYHKQ